MKHTSDCLYRCLSRKSLNHDKSKMHLFCTSDTSKRPVQPNSATLLIFGYERKIVSKTIRANCWSPFYTAFQTHCCAVTEKIQKNPLLLCLPEFTHVIETISPPDYTLQMFAGIYRDSAGVFCNICRENPVCPIDMETPSD